MSHIATVDIEIKDLDALDEACKRCGLQLVRHQRTFRWWGTHEGDHPVPDGYTTDDLGQCEHAIQIPGSKHSWEIGVVSRRDGRSGFTLMYDFFGGRGRELEKLAGEKCSALRQHYATVVAIKHQRSKGFNVIEQVLPNGSRRLVCTR